MIKVSDMPRIIAELDIPAIQQFRADHEPHLPPLTEKTALISLHMARSGADSAALKLRAYSHAWLTERGYPSMLPDALKPAAQRIYPAVTEAVGVSVTFRNKILEPAAPIVEKAMSDVVEETYASDREIRIDPDALRVRLIDVKDQTLKSLFGNKPH